MRYLVSRLGGCALSLVLVSMLVFALQGLLPGDPARVLAGEDADPEVIAHLHKTLHLDAPLPMRYSYWLMAALHGDLGQSQRNQEPVGQLILEKLPVTVELATLAMLIALGLGLPLGVLAAIGRDGWIDTAASGLALLSLSTPNFWLGILLILLFSERLGWLPASGYVAPADGLGANLLAMLMPAFVLGNAIAAVLMRHTRAAVSAALAADYVRTARAKGLPEWRVVLKHALRNALVPVITLGALEFGGLLSGAVLTEQVFSIPGFGKLVVDAVFNRDFAVVQGVVLYTAAAYLGLSLIADALYVLLNPKLRA